MRSVWGSLQFLGLERQHSFSVEADMYCEVASLDPRTVAVGSVAFRRMQIYATKYEELKAKSDEVDMVKLNKVFKSALAVQGDASGQYCVIRRFSADNVTQHHPGTKSSTETTLILDRISDIAKMERKQTNEQIAKLSQRVDNISQQLDKVLHMLNRQQSA